MKDMRNEKMLIQMFGEEGEIERMIPVEVFRHALQGGCKKKPRLVECLHCGNKHNFPHESFKRTWWEPDEKKYVIHYECPVQGCDGWYADFVEPNL